MYDFILKLHREDAFEQAKWASGGPPVSNLLTFGSLEKRQHCSGPGFGARSDPYHRGTGIKNSHLSHDGRGLRCQRSARTKCRRCSIGSTILIFAPAARIRTQGQGVSGPATIVTTPVRAIKSPHLCAADSLCPGPKSSHQSHQKFPPTAESVAHIRSPLPPNPLTIVIKPPHPKFAKHLTGKVKLPRQLFQLFQLLSSLKNTQGHEPSGKRT